MSVCSVNLCELRKKNSTTWTSENLKNFRELLEQIIAKGRTRYQFVPQLLYSPLSHGETCHVACSCTNNAMVEWGEQISGSFSPRVLWDALMSKTFCSSLYLIIFLIIAVFYTYIHHLCTAECSNYSIFNLISRLNMQYKCNSIYKCIAYRYQEIYKHFQNENWTILS